MQETSSQIRHGHAWLYGKGDPMGILQEKETWQCYEMVYAQTGINTVEGDPLDLVGFWDTDESCNPVQNARPSGNKHKIMEFT